MPKSKRLRGPTRPLAIRLGEAKLRVQLLENREQQHGLQKDAREIRRKLFKRGASNG